MLDDLTRGGRSHAAMRLALFLAVAVAFAIALALIAGAILSGASWGFWGLGLPHAIIALATLGAGLAMGRWFDREPDPLAALGLPLKPGAVGAAARGAAFGALLIGVLMAVQLAVGWLRPASDAGTAAAWLRHMGGMAALFTVAAASEELLFRGYGFQRLVEWLDVKLAVLVDAVLFGAIHVNNPGAELLPLINIALAGVLLAGVYLRTRSLWAAIGLHWSWNWFTTLFDRPVSGIEIDVPGYDFRELGPDLLTGGAFGPEGGLLMTFIALAAIAWVFRSPFPGPQEEAASVRRSR